MSLKKFSLNFAKTMLTGETDKAKRDGKRNVKSEKQGTRGSLDQ